MNKTSLFITIKKLIKKKVKPLTIKRKEKTTIV